MRGIIHLVIAAPDYCAQRRRLDGTMIGWLATAGSANASEKPDATRAVLGKLGAALASRDALDAKEFFEACEFYLRTRKRLRNPMMFDLACGHGLTGLLFAAFEPSVERVVLVDTRRPKSYDNIIAAFDEVFAV